MNEKQTKILARLDYVELGLTILGFIACCCAFVLTKIDQRYFFYLVSVLLGFNMIHSIKEIEKNHKKTKVVKYSKKALNTKKVSY